MRLQAYMITEGRTKKIDRDEFIKLATSKCKKYLKSFKTSAKIYRANIGTSVDFGRVNPKGGTPRKSAYATGNHYTLLMDNLPSWKKYPKRSQSLVCTTSMDSLFDRAATEKNAYMVFPFDGAKIGIATKDDIWVSFSAMNFYDWGDPLENLNRWYIRNGVKDTDVIKWSKSVTNEDVYEGNGIDWEKFVEGDPTQTIERWLRQWTQLKKKSTLWDHLNEYMSAKKNDFELKKVGDSLPHGREVWTDSECLMLSYPNLSILDDMGV